MKSPASHGGAAADGSAAETAIPELSVTAAVLVESSLPSEAETTSIAFSAALQARASATTLILDEILSQKEHFHDWGINE